jgi:hypothetical protein
MPGHIGAWREYDHGGRENKVGSELEIPHQLAKVHFPTGPRYQALITVVRYSIRQHVIYRENPENPINREKMIAAFNFFRCDV